MRLERQSCGMLEVSALAMEQFWRQADGVVRSNNEVDCLLSIFFFFFLVFDNLIFLSVFNS